MSKISKIRTAKQRRNEIEAIVKKYLEEYDDFNEAIYDYFLGDINEFLKKEEASPFVDGAEAAIAIDVLQNSLLKSPPDLNTIKEK